MQVGRTLLLAQVSAHPWKLSPEVTLEEMNSYAASPSFDELLHQLAYGETQQGAPLNSVKHPLVIGWGRHDRVCLRQAVLPGHEALSNLKSEGKLLAGGFPVGERAIAFIVEFDSPEELDSVLMGIPFWGIVKTKVTPLQGFEDRHDQDREFAEQLEQSLQQ
jgi:muconolactone delta-isomerase